MTDTDKNSSAPAVEPAPSATPAPDASVRQATEGRAASGKRSAGALILGVLLILLALVLGGALYYQNQQYRALQADAQQERASYQQLIDRTREQADQALSQVRQQAAQLRDLQATLEATNGQVQELDQALQLMTDSGSDLLLLNDIDHLLAMAEQQLAMGGNVANALISLESAQARLARANRPALAALQQSINGDIDRLRAVSTINLPALSERVNRLSDLVGSATLLVPEKTEPPAEASDTGPAQSSAPASRDAAAADPEATSAGWQALAGQAWDQVQETARLAARDLRELLDVRRVDDPAALLMSPEQALRFREALKQRVMMAQLALLMQQTRIWRTELAHLATAIDERYDMRDASARQALKLARDLYDTPIEIELPGLDNSLAALAAAREAEQSALRPSVSDGGSPADGAGQTHPERPAPGSRQG
ncbi:uroporphyrinogen-III C-methyltransferase [Castellaniella sp.]|uniref:uroporphyrinogen-III C-methyltransferase n=1 Tax=Castellaniella sp. TaxID=1955812 RepID=UPI00356A2391